MCNCEGNTYNINMCCTPRLADADNYYTKKEVDGIIDGIEFSGITEAEVDEKIDEAMLSLSGYSTTAEVGDMISQATSGKQDTLSAGTNIDITDNVVSMPLPISSGLGRDSLVVNQLSLNVAEGNYSFVEGRNNTAYSPNSHVEGRDNQTHGGTSHAEGLHTMAYGDVSHTEGEYTEAGNRAEHASGRYNVSHVGSTEYQVFNHSGNTLFSVGNGTDENSRHNAFEIMQNGDIYISNGGQDIKLQDALDGKADASNVYTKTEVNNIVSSRFWCGTQAEYDALAVKENDVLYLIHN